MVDYSRWDKIIEEEEKAEQSQKLTQDLIKIQQEKPEAIQKMKEELEAMKINALKVKNNQKQSGNAGDMKKTFNSQADVMRSELERLKKEQEKMDAKQKELEQLASAGDGASILKFFEAQGLSREDMQRMLGGNNDDSKSVIEKAQKANIKTVLFIHDFSFLCSSFHLLSDRLGVNDYCGFLELPETGRQ